MSKCIGNSVQRYDGLAHATGNTKYIDDYVVPNTLMVKAFRSPVCKGEVLSIDTEDAMKLPGVECIITHEDIPNVHNGWPVIAKSIRYKGEPIAAVAAVDEKTAMRAIDLIKVDIEEQPAVLDPFKAMDSSSPKVRPDGNIYKFDGEDSRKVIFGDIDVGFSHADYIIENDYFLSPVEHAPLEPTVSLAVPEADGRLTIYGMSQGVHATLSTLFKVLRAEPDSSSCRRWAPRYRQRGITCLNDIKFVGGKCGGGFGGKAEPMADPIVAILALITGQPVKWRWTREEEFKYSTYRGAWHMHIKDGVKKDGQLVARKIKTLRDAGAYEWNNPYVVQKYCFSACGPYYIPNVYVEGYCVFTNKCMAGGMRGFGVTPSTFAIEVQMDKIASEIGIDPWELRFINAFHNGDLTSTKRKLDSVYLIEVMKRLAEKADIELPDKLLRMTSEPRR